MGAGQHQPRAAVLSEGSQLGALHLLPGQLEARIRRDDQSEASIDLYQKNFKKQTNSRPVCSGHMILGDQSGDSTTREDT